MTCTYILTIAHAWRGR